MKLSEILRKLKENPDDLSALGEAIAQAENLEEQTTTQTDQIGKLQENYRKAIQMIPVPGEEPKEEESEEEKMPTIEEAAAKIAEDLQN